MTCRRGDPARGPAGVISPAPTRRRQGTVHHRAVQPERAVLQPLTDRARPRAGARRTHPAFCRRLAGRARRNRGALDGRYAAARDAPILPAAGQPIGQPGQVPSSLAGARLPVHGRFLPPACVVGQGRPVADVADELGISRATGDAWLTSETDLRCTRRRIRQGSRSGPAGPDHADGPDPCRRGRGERAGRRLRPRRPHRRRSAPRPCRRRTARRRAWRRGHPA